MNHLQFRNRFSLFFIVAVLGVCLVSCKDDEEEEPEVDENAEFSQVDERFIGYFLSFETEAAKRGYLIDLGELGITASISPLNGQGEDVAGRCTFNDSRPNHITVDQTFWENSSDLLREFIVFHELGHCVLYRDHRDDQDSNGLCVSIMRSAEAACEENFFSTTRTARLDELFDAQFVDELRDDD